jgi:hypothetical protein
MNAKILAIIIGVVLVAAAIVTIALVATNHHPDPTQMWIDCLNRQIDNPSVVCVEPS